MELIDVKDPTCFYLVPLSVPIQDYWVTPLPQGTFYDSGPNTYIEARANEHLRWSRTPLPELEGF